jgi:hypothetical protein
MPQFVLSDMKIPTLTATVGHGELSVQHSLLTLVTLGPEQSAHAAVRVAVLSDMKIPTLMANMLYPCNRPRRLPHFLYNRLTDGGEVVSLTRRPPFNPRKIPGTHFC